MANQYLKLRRSSVPGKVPDTASLDFGEIALNTYDGLAFMKKDGPNGVEVVPIGSNEGAFTGSFSGSFTGSLFGTSSWAQNSISASYSINALSASYSLNAISASYAYTASSAEKSFSSISSSYAYTASSAQKSFSSISSSNAATASSADNFIVRGNITGSNAIFTGTVTAQKLVVQTISSSVIYSSGSNTFGDELIDRQTFTGSVRITGSLSLNGDSVIVSGQTSSMSVLNAVYAQTASTTLTASYVNPLRQNVIISGSLAQGYNVISNGSYSHAEGESSIASGSYSHAEGQYTIAQGNYSHTEGQSSIASGSYSHAEGQTFSLLSQIYAYNPITVPNIALGKGSHAEGTATYARNDGSHAAGFFTSASGLYSNTIGSYNKAGELSNAEGHRTNAGYFESESFLNVAIIRRPTVGSSIIDILIGGSNQYNSNTPFRFTSSFAIGDKVVFRKNYYPTFDTSSGFPFWPDGGVMSQSLDYYVGTVSGVFLNNTFTQLRFTDMVIEDLPPWYTCAAVYNQSVPLGAVANITRPINLSSFTSSLGDFINGPVFPQIPIALDKTTDFVNNYTYGDSTGVDPNGSFIGAGSHTEGRKTLSRGIYNHAEGHYTTASGHFSHAEGYYTITNAKYQHAQGQFNMTSSVESAFIIGNGTGSGSRSNLVHAAGTQFQITGSLIVTGSITGSLFGTASWALNFLTGSVTSASYAATASLAVSSSYALTASHVNNLDLFRVFTGSVEAKVDINPNSIFLIKSGSINFLNISSSGNTTLSSDLFIVKNLTTQQPVLTVSQSVVKIATQSLDPSGTTDAGSIWFTSTAMYIGLE